MGPPSLRCLDPTEPQLGPVLTPRIPISACLDSMHPHLCPVLKPGSPSAAYEARTLFQQHCIAAVSA